MASSIYLGTIHVMVSALFGIYLLSCGISARS